MVGIARPQALKVGLKRVEIGAGDPLLEDNGFDSVVFIGAAGSVQRSCTRNTMLFEVRLDALLIKCFSITRNTVAFNGFGLEELAFGRTHEHRSEEHTSELQS